MKSDYIASAIGQADDKYIDEYAALEPEKRKQEYCPWFCRLRQRQRCSYLFLCG